MQVTGIIVVKIDGQDVLASDVKFQTGGFERTAQYASGRHIGPSQAPICSRLTLTLKHVATTDLVALVEGLNHTAEIQTDTGVTWLMNEAYVTNPPEITSGEGSVDIEYMGQPAVVA